METCYATSPDNIRIAYDRSGSGPTILLVHGGGGSRQDWHHSGYVERLQEDFTVISLDLRGHGDSDMPIDPADYAADKMAQDILAVADACGVERFNLWAMSFGGKVSRYLATESDRIVKLVLMGTPLGPAVTVDLRQEIEGFCEHWQPILQAQADGSLELNTLAQSDREFMDQFNVPVIMAWGRAMLDWPSVEPTNFRCPTLLLIGSEDQPVMASIRDYEPFLQGTKVQYHILEGFTHDQVFEEIDDVFAIMQAFTQS